MIHWDSELNIESEALYSCLFIVYVEEMKFLGVLFERHDEWVCDIAFEMVGSIDN